MDFLDDMYKLFVSKESIMLIMIFIICSFILDFIVTKFIVNVFEMKVTNKRKLVFLVSTFICVSINRLMVPIPYCRISSLIISTILIYFVLNQTIERALISSIIVNTILMLGEILFSKLFRSIYSINNFIVDYHMLIYRISILICLNILFIIIYFIFKKINFKLNIRNNLNLKDRNKILAKCILGMSIIIFNALLLMYFKNSLLTFLVITNIIIIESYCIRDLLNSNKLQEANIKIEALREHNKNLNIMYDDIRSFKHDFSNIVQALGGYITTENIEGLKDMYSRLLEEIKAVNNMELLNPETINNPAIYNILNSKYCIARSCNIDMNIEVLIDLNDIEINTLDFCRILGILLDNAIEAAKECKKKEISVRFEKDHKVNRNLVIVENTYQNLDVDISRIFDKEYTSKSEKKSHGLGLWRVKKILDRNNNLNLYSFKGNKFVQQLEVYNNTDNNLLADINVHAQ